MNNVIEFPSTFTEKEKGLYMEYLLRESLTDEKWYMGSEKYKEIQSMLEKVKLENDYQEIQKKKMLLKLSIARNKNYFKNKFRK